MDEIHICNGKSDRKLHYKTDIACMKFRIRLLVLDMMNLLLMMGIEEQFEWKFLSDKISIKSHFKFA